MKASDDLCPYVAEVETIDLETGEPTLREVRPEDVLESMVKGMSSDEIAEVLQVPVEAVDHVICHIPHMMAWRREMRKKQGKASKYASLPDVSLEVK